MTLVIGRYTRPEQFARAGDMVFADEAIAERWRHVQGIELYVVPRERAMLPGDKTESRVVRELALAEFDHAVKSGNRHFIIDMDGDRAWMRSKTLKFAMCNGRHYNVSVTLVTPYLKDISPDLRVQAAHVYAHLRTARERETCRQFFDLQDTLPEKVHIEMRDRAATPWVC